MLKSDLREIIDQSQRRVFARRVQAARTGINTDPSVSLEIEDLTSFVDAAEIVLMIEEESSISEAGMSALRPYARKVGIVL